jgi:ParB/RepB/Spo0J family partition protein
MSGHALTGVYGFKRRTDMFFVDPRKIIVVDGWNPRTDFSGEDELMASIIENGVEVPLKVRKVVDGENLKMELVDGERRLRATLRAIADGHAIESVPVQVEKKGTNEIESLVTALIRNDGKPHSPSEEADAYKRLEKWGLTQADIAKKVGKSVSHIRNRLELAGASPEVKAAVAKKEIPIGEAQQIAKNPSIESQSEALRRRKSAPRVRAATYGYKKGVMWIRGESGLSCEPIRDVLSDTDFKDSLKNAGYDPDTLKISIKRAEKARDE